MVAQNITEVAALARENPSFAAALQNDPVGTLENIAVPLQTDVWIYRAVVFSLGGTVLLAVCGAMLLAFVGKTTPEVVTALGSAAIGALAGLLVPSPVRR